MHLVDNFIQSDLEKVHIFSKFLLKVKVQKLLCSLVIEPMTVPLHFKHHAWLFELQEIIFTIYNGTMLSVSIASKIEVLTIDVLTLNVFKQNVQELHDHY